MDYWHEMRKSVEEVIALVGVEPTPPIYKIGALNHMSLRAEDSISKKIFSDKVWSQLKAVFVLVATRFVGLP